MKGTSIIVGILIGCILTIAITEYFSINTTFLKNTGVIHSNIGVYWDLSCLNKTEYIDWGVVHKGTTETYVLYIENARNASMTIQMSTTDWNPSLSTRYLHFSWNYSGSPIPKYSAKPISFTLLVDSDAESIVFSFTIIITGSWI